MPRAHGGSAQGCSSLSPRRAPWIYFEFPSANTGFPWSWGPWRGTGWPPLPQECEMLPHMQLALILQSFFSPSVFFQLMSCCQSPY